MSPKAAAMIYRSLARLTPLMVALCDHVGSCPPCDRLWLAIDAASISFDLVAAEDAKRRSVAW